MKLKSQILTSSNSFKDNVKKHLKDIENIDKIAKIKLVRRARSVAGEAYKARENATEG